jgi:two-component system sensor histidine kinase DegS
VDVRNHAKPPGGGDDVLKTLLTRLSQHVREHAESPDETVSALQVCAAEIRRLAQQAMDDDARDDLDLVSDLLLEIEISIARSERRWSRLTYDLHDGALQNVAVMRMHLSAFRSQLQKAPTERSELADITAFADELESGLRSLDSSLRELIESFETPAVADQPFEEAIHDFVRDFASDTEIPVAVDIKGPFEVLTRSQRIALFRIFVEAMANVRQHSDARKVWVHARVQGRQARLRVRDNGRGLDVKRTPARAAKRGRLGLVGMAERARLLGGQLDVDSKPGGPTTIAVSIPAGRVEDRRPAPVRRRPRRTTRS